LVLLGFIRPNPAFSKGYGRKNKKNPSPLFGRPSSALARFGVGIVIPRILIFARNCL
jgi:hypothetical protein